MQASYHIAILSAQEIERHVQERIRDAEREHLLRSLRQHRTDRIRNIRVAIGSLVVSFGRRIGGSQEQTERWYDVPEAIRPAR